MLNRIEKFTLGESNFLYIDFSNFKTNGEFKKFIETLKPILKKYEKKSVYTISNTEGVRFDTETKSIIADWMEFNESYVIKGAILGVDGIRRIFINSILSMAGRKNMVFAATKEQAVDLLTGK
jgi:hypothetical protein